MDKTVESEMIDYIYERMIKLMVPVTNMPLSFWSFALTDTFKPVQTAVLAFNRDEFQKIITLLVGFERHTKPISASRAINTPTSISRRMNSRMVSEHNSRYRGLCHSHTRLCEMLDLLNFMDDDFIGYLKITSISIKNTVERRKFEFSVGLGGFDIFRIDGKVLPAHERFAVRRKWNWHCVDANYQNDFSKLINLSDDDTEHNALVFLMDYKVIFGL